MRKIYVYGVIGSDQEGGSGHIGTDSKDPEVYALSHKDIACVVKNTDVDSFFAMPKETLGRHLVEHQVTIERIMKDHTIIPFKFATIIEDEGELEKVLRSGYGAFKEKLETLADKIELDVAASWNDLNGVIRTIGGENSRIKAFKAEISRRPPKDTLQDRMKIGCMIKDALDEKRAGLQSEMLDALKEKAIDSRKHERMDDKMIFNCAFLLDKDKEGEFDRILDELNARYREEINFRCVGPLPPYSFSTIELKRMGHDKIKEARRLLGVNEEATVQEIKESYRKLALEFHPDQNSGKHDVRKRFEDISRAHKLLIDCCRQAVRNGKQAKDKDFISIDILKV